MMREILEYQNVRTDTLFIGIGSHSPTSTVTEALVTRYENKRRKVHQRLSQLHATLDRQRDLSRGLP